MALFSTTGNPIWKKGIPRNSKVRLEELPSRNLVDEQIITGTYAKDIDPGFYQVVITKYLGINADKRNVGLRWDQRFFHGITRDEYIVLSNMQPTMTRGRMVGEGFRFFCQAPQCEEYFSTRIAALLHELEIHKGLKRADLTKNAEVLMATNEEAIAEKYEADQAAKSPKKGRSFNSGTMEK